MKTAALSSSPTVGGGWAAAESAVDAYATRVLQASTPPEAFLDTSLGPYVTSVLRGADDLNQDVTALAEFEALVELLEDQCSMEPEVASRALRLIAEAVVTGIVPSESRKNQAGGLYTNGVGSSLDSYPIREHSLEGAALTLQQLSIDPYTPTATGGPSPLKPSNLIPVDLLGFLDDPSPHQQQYPMRSIPAVSPVPVTPQPEEQMTTNDEAFPPLGVAASTLSSPSKKGRKTKGAPLSKSRNSDKELAAALFRPSRMRQNSIEKEEASPPQSFTTDSDPYFEQQLASCVEILLSMNGDVGEMAATEATLMAHGDFNVAQYIIDKALTAPPVCRHMLHDGCYRSDCQFGHDVEGHTCLFWLRGRCTKPVSVCKFLHGFHPRLMEGIVSSGTSTEFQEYSYSHPGFASNSPVTPWQAESSAQASASHHYSSSVGSNNDTSFANIASRGPNQFSPVPTPKHSIVPEASTPIPTVKIPQNLWNAHENRDASVFHIADPIERYRQVSLMNGGAARHSDFEIIDLHFQSTKTFATVLEQILPQKLHTATDAGVWIITGTGHHVGTKTHQKGGGALERSVIQWLQDEGYSFAKGKDRNGLGGAILVKR
jgi:Smr domain